MAGNINWDLIVIGGGAAGFYGAIQAATRKPGLKVLILEKASKLLTKVGVSGGGRCNVTHGSPNPFELARHYPRGAKSLKTIFKQYDNQHVVTWFAGRGVKLKTEEDGRLFPNTDRSATIIECFLSEAARLHIRIETGQEVLGLTKAGEFFTVSIQQGEPRKASAILVAVGGSNRPGAYQWIAALGHTIVPPIPSLFTFNDRDKRFKDLMGIAVPDAEVKIVGTKYVRRGPVLITHWGLSGPAVITLSAWGAAYLHSIDYRFEVLVSWIGPLKEAEFRVWLLEHKEQKGKQKVVTNPIYSIPQRLWQRLCEQAEIVESKRWEELSQRHLNKLLESTLRCSFHIQGKTTYKDEFVTCGGVEMAEVDPETMESKRIPQLYFAGEVLDIDGETGGFNFQAAWSTAFLAARSISDL